MAVAVGMLATTASFFFLTSGAQGDECPVQNLAACLPGGGNSTASSVPLPLPTTTTTQPRPKADPAVAAARLFELVNQERKSRGIPALTRRSDVDAIAKAHGDRMAAAYTIWHNDDYFTSVTKRLIGASFVGENVAKNSEIDDMHRRLMNSPHHRENILDPRFTQIGVGVGVAPNGELFGTEDFMTPLTVTAPTATVTAPPVTVRPTTTTAPAPVAAPDGPVELAMPGPMDMAGADVAGPPSAGDGSPSGRSPAFVLLCAAALAGVVAAGRKALLR